MEMNQKVFDECTTQYYQVHQQAIFYILDARAGASIEQIRLNQTGHVWHRVKNSRMIFEINAKVKYDFQISLTF